MGRLLTLALSAIAIMALIAFSFAPREGEKDTAPGPETSAKPAAIQAPPEEAALLLRRDSTGQFHVTAQANGSDVRFLIDTGADTVALTEQTAQELGILPTPDQFQPMMETASGTGYGAAVTIDRLEVAGHEFNDVDAIVAQGLSVNLLGQSVLRRLGKVELQGDKMVIRQRSY